MKPTKVRDDTPVIETVDLSPITEFDVIMAEGMTAQPTAGFSVPFGGYRPRPQPKAVMPPELLETESPFTVADPEPVFRVHDKVEVSPFTVKPVEFVGVQEVSFQGVDPGPAFGPEVDYERLSMVPEGKISMVPEGKISMVPEGKISMVPEGGKLSMTMPETPVRQKAVRHRPQAVSTRPKAVRARPKAVRARPQAVAPPLVHEALATWSPPQDLTAILNPQGAAYAAHKNQFGVYIITERGSTRPMYIGMSTNLTGRLSTYASGKSGNPVDRVTEDHLAHASDHEFWIYMGKRDAEQQAWRKHWMDQRGLQIQVAHTQDLMSARKLELTLIRLYEMSLGIELDNKVKYKTIVPFPEPK